VRDPTVAALGDAALMGGMCLLPGLLKPPWQHRDVPADAAA